MSSLGSSLASLLVRPHTSDPVAWLESNIYLDATVSANKPGPLSLRAQPWMHQLLRDVADPRVQHITVAMGTQSGKTLFEQLSYLYLAEFRPLPAGIFFPDDLMAEAYVKTRLMPLLQCNRRYADRLPPPQRQGVPNTICMPGMSTFYSGTRSPSKLSSRPIAYVFLDEAAKLVKVKAAEAHPYRLLLERTKAQPVHKVIEASTPAAYTDPFWESYNNGTQSHYWVPCPHCGESMQYVFDRDHLTWQGNTMEEVMETARIICPACHGQLDDMQRREAMQHGEWRADNPDPEQGHVSYHLNTLYSPFVPLGEFAWEYVKACHSIIKVEALHNYYNSWLALPWEDYKTKITDEDVRALINPNLRRGELPADMVYLAVGVDPGQTEHHYVVTAVCAGGVLKVVDWGVLQSITSDKGRQGLRWLMDSLRYTRAGKWYRPDILYCDAGYNTNAVYDECRASIPGLLNPTKGTNSPGTWGRSIVKTCDLELYTYSDFGLKVELYGQRFRQQEVMLPVDSSRELMAGLSGQTLLQTSTGQRRWKKVDNDHYGDALKLTLLSMWVAAENDDLRAQLTVDITPATDTPAR